MRIGIIGAGIVGRTVGTLAARLGHDVMLSNSRGPDTLFSLRYATQCQVGTAEEAAAFGDVVVVAIPLKAWRAVPVSPLAGKVVLDANNYYPARDGQITELDRLETTTSEMLAQHLPQSRIIKAFNAVIMGDLETDGRPAGTPGRRALPIAGDDAEGKTITTTLLDAFGFDTVDAGPLFEGWRFERDMPAYCVPMDRQTLITTLAHSVRGETTERQRVPAS